MTSSAKPKDQSPAAIHARRRGMPELTVRVVIAGVILSVVMGAANVYVGLKAGMTVSASIPAAVMAMLFFRMILKGGTVLEANQVQTCASAGESLAAGIIFTMPALVMVGYWTEFDFWTVTGIAFTGGLLGILFMIPMRRVFVVDNEELSYPEGIACAAVLEAGDESGADSTAARALLMGGALGALFKIAEKLFEVISSSLEWATSSGSRLHYIGGNVSPMLVAVGLIVRLNVALLIFIGGAISWLIAMPIFDATSVLEATGGEPVDAAWSLWSSQVRYVGVGAMVVGGLSSIVAVRHGLVRAVTELVSRFTSDEVQEEHDRDIPSKVILGLVLLAVGLVSVLYYHFTGNVGITVVATIVMVVMAFFFTAVASYIVGLVGNSNSPVSGMAITTVLATGGLLTLFGYNEGTPAMVAIIGVAAVVCCVACTAGDVCNDLKTGSLVGATPYRQQIMQVLGVTVAAGVMQPILSLLHKGTPGGIGGRELSAPQAGLIKSLAEGFTGAGTLPWNLIGIGAVVGVLILITDAYLVRRKSSFRAYLMPIAVGMYLPFGLAIPILAGGLIAHFATRGAKDGDEIERKLQRGVLFSSGVIAGESLMAVAVAGLAVRGIENFVGDSWTGPFVGATVAACAFALFAFWRVTNAGAKDAD
ncbi:MAG: putative OPT family oligopeptide transporter [Planctomycetota bacterium]|jgi:putative OPT family oligopeptide transporter